MACFLDQLIPTRVGLLIPDVTSTMPEWWYIYYLSNNFGMNQTQIKNKNQVYECPIYPAWLEVELSY